MTTFGSVGRAYDFILVGAFGYPAGDASSNRLLALAKAARSAGYRPLVVNDATPANGGGRPGDIHTFGGVDYVNIGPARRGRLDRRMARLSRPIRVIMAIRRLGYRKGESYAGVASGLYTLSMHTGLKWILGMTTISDVVERHDPQQFPSGRRSKYFVRTRWTSLLSRFLPDGVIAVSRTLEVAYGKTRPVLRVPPLVDTDEFLEPMKRPPSMPLTLLYAGTPSRKDQLGALVDAVLDHREPEGGRPVRLLIAGADAAELADSQDVGAARVAKFGLVVTALGKLPRTEVIRHLNLVDFSVLLRPLEGYAQAGFPSKVPESLAAGCPVLGNITSDLGEYLRDGENAIVVEVDSNTGAVGPSLRDALIRAASMTDDQLFVMKQATRSSSEDLHYAQWSLPLRRWLRTLHA